MSFMAIKSKQQKERFLLGALAESLLPYFSGRLVPWLTAPRHANLSLLPQSHHFLPFLEPSLPLLPSRKDPYDYI